MIFLFLMLSIIGQHLIFRGVIPFTWIIYNIFTIQKHLYVLTLHMIYLLVLIFVDVKLLKLLVNKSISTIPHIVNYNNKKENNYLGIIILGYLLIIAIAIFQPFPLPILGERGSDTVIFIDLEYKSSLWFISVLLLVIKLYLFFVIFKSKKKPIKIAAFILIIIYSIIFGKKSAILSILSSLTFLYIIYRGYQLKLLKIRNYGIYLSKRNMIIAFFISAFLFIGIYFALLQYFRTLQQEFEIPNVLNASIMFINVVISSATIYLVQFFLLDGINYYNLYSEALGNFGVLTYFLNPILKFLFNEGIDMAIGPFLNYQLFGSTTPHGVNPTIFFELVFVLGSVELGFIFSILVMIIVYKLAKFSINYIIYHRYGDIHKTSFALAILQFLLFFTADTLNAIRMYLPVLFCILMIGETTKILKIVSNKRKYSYQNKL